MFTKYLDQKIKKKEMLCVSICEENLVYSSQFEQHFRQKFSKILQIFQCILQFDFTLYSDRQFCYDHIFTAEVTAVSILITKCKML